MTCIDHYSIKQNSFIALKKHVMPVYPFYPLNPWHLLFTVLHGLAFARMPFS